MGASSPLGLLALLASVLAPSLANNKCETSKTSENDLPNCYLIKYGYQKERIWGGVNQPALMKFQGFAGLQPTGKITKETVVTRKKPRCGVKDSDNNSTRIFAEFKKKRKRRFVLEGSRFNLKRKDISYNIKNYPRSLSKTEVDGDIARAFRLWESAKPLRFTKKAREPQLEISFESRNQCDRDPLDGPGGTLAHAFFPIFGGDIHFDADENWTVNSSRRINLYLTAAHEIGHS